MADALLVVDKQNDFEADGGALTAGRPAQTTTPYILERIRTAVGAGKLVIIGLDTHQENDPEFERMGRHCVRGEWGWELVPSLKLLVDGERRAGRVMDFPLGAALQPETALLMEANRITGKGMVALIEKRTLSLFYNTVATDLLQVWQVNEARIAGLMTHLSVFHTVAGACFAAVHPVLLAQGVADFAPDRAAIYVEDMKRYLGATVEE